MKVNRKLKTFLKISATITMIFILILIFYGNAFGVGKIPEKLKQSDSLNSSQSNSADNNSNSTSAKGEEDKNNTNASSTIPQQVFESLQKSDESSSVEQHTTNLPKAESTSAVSTPPNKPPQTESKATTSSQPNVIPKTSSTSSSSSKTSSSSQSLQNTVPLPQEKPTQVKPVEGTNGKELVGYFASWSSTNNYYPKDVNASQLTHINYAFANITSDNKIVMNNPTIDLTNFDGLRKLRTQNPNLKLVISVGGWDGSKYFSNVALTAESRETFADSCVSFITTHGLDGIDIDWEYPVSGGLAGNYKRPEDKQNFTKLILTIRQRLNELEQKNLKKYYLTIAGAASTGYIKNIELLKILPYIDYIFIMGYDLHGPWDQFSDLNAPLHTPKDSSPQYSTSVYDVVKIYLNAGAPANKLVLGMPFYGYKYSLTTNNNNGLYQSFTKANSISYNKVISDYLSNSIYSKFLHPLASVPYLSGNNTFISYEDEDSIAKKVQLANGFGLAGVGAWELSNDKNGVLLTSAYNALN